MGLLVGLARQALTSPRLASPLPCLPHWLAGADHVIVAVSAPGGIAGLQPGDLLQRLGETELTGRSGGLWDAALRTLPAGTTSYQVTIARDTAPVVVTLPCASARAGRLHDAERNMWTAVARQDWAGCRAHGQAMQEAFGARFSPPLLMMTRCAAAAGSPDPALTHALADALLDEWAAHPSPSPDLREQVQMLVRELDASPHGAAAFTRPLRERMARLGITAPPPPDR